MARASLVLAAAACATLACNNGYQFTPAGRCLIQPGSVHVRLDPTSRADILFVVDDSPSTNEKQAGLAASFRDFIDRMVQTNVARTGRGLEPIDFHVAVTTTAVFEAKAAPGWCVAGNGCCQASACTPVASCARGTGGGCGAGQVCLVEPRLDSTGQFVVGEQHQCCAASACAPVPGCSPGDRCPAIATTYPNPFPSPGFCTPGQATAGAPYPAGALMAAGSNAKVLDFWKDLDWASWNGATPDPRIGDLVRQFQENVKVGSCGSGQEQGLEAARLSIEKAARGELAGAPGWPRPGSKLIVVWVADEDDCSSPASAPLVMSVFSPGADSCVFDKHRPAADQREIPVSAYADFFAGLAHPGGAAAFAAAFIVSPATDACHGAWAGGERYLALAEALRARGIEVVEGTVCDAYPPASFGPVLQKIADLAPPPSMLELPSQPASRDLVSVSIADANGITRRTCTAETDWCFVDCADPSPTPACLPAGTTRCIGINHASGSCAASPGETYSAQYLGLLPEGGCATAADCSAVLGGAAGDWRCTIEPGASRGTCTCKQ
ncbi:MAG TPA: hypothetical protein VFL83_20230 [Anaeromyxobacter sp.]|nr:hypothetical protein [Anaeromyxobacter sp.]